MSTAEGSDHSAHDRPLFRLAMWWGHHSVRWLPIPFAMGMAALAVSWWLPDLPPAQNVALLAVPMVIFGATGLGVLCTDLVHGRNLCLSCVNDPPLLNPQAAVDRHLRTLRFFHARRRMRAAIGLSFLSTAAMVAGRSPMLPAPGRAGVTALFAAGVAANVYLMHVYRTHRRLHVWCPWCRRGGGGPDDPQTAPTPDPVGRAHA